VIKRVVAYGCSHAYGSEMSGRHNNDGSKEFVFGNLVAKHYNVPFHRVAEPGNSNEGMVHNTIENCEEGDLCIFSSIQLRRAMYHPIEDDDPIGPQHLTQFEVGTVYDKSNKKIPSWLHINFIKEVRKKEFEEKGRQHSFMNNSDKPHVPAIAEYFIGYRWEFLPLFIDYLKYYASWNAIALSRGAFPVNFIFDESENKLDRMLNFEGKGSHFRNGQTLNSSKHFLNWLQDPTRICKGNLSMMKWVLKQQGINDLPDNRQAHLGKEQQPLIAKEIITKCEELGYE